MKKNNIYIILTLLLLFSFNNVYAQVSDRELIILASLAYEEVPVDGDKTTFTEGNTTGTINCSYDEKNIYKTNTDELNYYKTKSSTESNCYFKSIDNATMTKQSSDLKKSYEVPKYIEGFSQRKADSLVSTITLSRAEPGPSYYFLNGVEEEEYKDWKIDAYSSKINVLNDADFSGEFYAITFKRTNSDGTNDYVIAYRGTDFNDLAEWIFQDLGYAFGNASQTEQAWNYAKSEYLRIQASDSNAHIYVTGHSLGAYLAQVGAAAIYYQDNNLTNFEKAVYFNGMGADAVLVGIASDILSVGKNRVGNNIGENVYVTDIIESLASIGTNKNTGDDCIKVNWSDKYCSTGKLILYRTAGDPVSAIGVHYGEIYQVNGSLEAISNHSSAHALLSTKADLIDISDLMSNFYINNFAVVGEDSVSFDTSNETTVYTKMMESLDTLNSTSILDNNSNISGLYANILVEEGQLKNIEIPLLFRKIAENLISNVKKYSTNFNLIEYMNVAHETDSLSCLINGNNGVPKITGVKVSNSSYSETDPDTGIITYYTNQYSNVYEPVSVDGCHYGSLAIYKNDNLVQNSDLLFYTLKQTEAKATYRIEASHGVEVDTLKLDYFQVDYDVNDYKTGNTENDSYTFNVVYDGTKPICSASLSNTNIVQNGANPAVLTVTCNEKLPEDQYGNMFVEASSKLGYFSFSNSICTYDGTQTKCTMNVNGNKKTTLLSKVSDTINITAKDKAGNESNLNVSATWNKKASLSNTSSNKTSNTSECSISASSLTVTEGNSGSVTLTCPTSKMITVNSSIYFENSSKGCTYDSSKDNYKCIVNFRAKGRQELSLFKEIFGLKSNKYSIVVDGKIFSVTANWKKNDNVKCSAILNKCWTESKEKVCKTTGIFKKRETCSIKTVKNYL